MRLPRLVTAVSLAAAALAAVVAMVLHEPLLPHPAQAQESTIAAAPLIGDVPRQELVTPIAVPGSYGLGVSPAGHRYAIVGGYLVRIDDQSGKVLSVLRQLPQMHH